MIRRDIVERDSWVDIVEDQGLTFHHTDEGLYWDESVCYELTSKEVDDIEDSTNDLHQLCLEAVQEVIQKDRLSELGINLHFHSKIKDSWFKSEPSLYGRFDLYLNNNSLKMLEYNSDTPTSILEASVIQWNWMKDAMNKDQFNSIHENLIERFKFIADYYKTDSLHFACDTESEEDSSTTGYLASCAEEASISSVFLDINDIGYNEQFNKFVDESNYTIDFLFKLYPIEWMVEENFGKNLIKSDIKLIEPYWKMILSNKAILPILWEMAPNHKNLLPSYFVKDRIKLKDSKYVIKPFYSREGNNLTIIENEKEIFRSKDSGYGNDNLIIQEFMEPLNIDGNIPVIGSWIIGNTASGIGIREDKSIVTSNFSKFIPHYFEGTNNV